MNNANLIGRLTKDPEFSTTTSGTSVCRFTLAVDRPFKSKDGEREADFLPIVTWRGTAEICGKYLRKGHKCGVQGIVQTRTYDDKEGNRRYVTEIMADKIFLLEPKSANECDEVPAVEPVQGKKKTQRKEPVEVTLPPLEEEDLPF